MTSDPLTNLIRMQDPDGCFPSEVAGPNWTHRDRNGFTTAMVLRSLRDFHHERALEQMRITALDFVERCRSRQTPLAFGFWPEDMRPAWSTRLPADIDDTAIITIELLRHGRLSRRDGLRTVCLVLLTNRNILREDQIHPPWVTSGAFHTWIGPPGKPNIIDCCVNANAAALMALVGANHLPGYQEAIHTISSGIKWAGDDPIRQRSLTPFYPDRHELLDAVEHAVECGAATLSSALNQLRHLMGDCERRASTGCCSSAYGATVWRCRGLEEARLLRAQQMLKQIAN